MYINNSIKTTCKNEDGMALVITLILLFLMAMLGTTLFSVSTTEIKISRNNKFRTEAFYAAERGNEYAHSDPNIYATIGTGSVNIPLTGVSLQSGLSTASGTVSYLTTGNPPRGSGVDISDFKANYFLVEITGTGPGNSSLPIESNLAKIVPNL